MPRPLRSSLHSIAVALLVSACSAPVDDGGERAVDGGGSLGTDGGAGANTDDRTDAGAPACEPGCGDHARCLVEDGVARCVCNVGSEPVDGACPASICDGSPCHNGGTCI